jgi:hypothetical protein
MESELRKSRNSKVRNNKLEIPFDISKLGSKDDPCFGKHYDLNAPECQRCGDIELCAIAIQQNLTIIRGEIEQTQPFKDLEETKIKGKDKIQTRVDELKKKGKGPVIIRIKICKEFNISKKKALKYL